MIFTVFTPFSTSADELKISGQKWYDQPKSKKIGKMKDYLQYGKLSKGKSYVGGIVRSYGNKKAYIMSQTKQSKSWVEEASLYSAYEKFDKKQTGKYEMG